MKTFVVVPFKNEQQRTIDFMRALTKEEFDYRLMLDNGSTLYTAEAVKNECKIDKRFMHINMSGFGIYQMWNYGWKYALDHSGKDGEVNVAILNNDISFLPGTIERLSDALRSEALVGITYPDYDVRCSSLGSIGPTTGFPLRQTTGTYRSGGMCGWAFMIRGEAARWGVPFIDEKLKWWFGDDFIEMKFREAGYKVCRLVGLPVDHASEATASNGENNWTHEAKAKDIEYWKANYGPF